MLTSSAWPQLPPSPSERPGSVLSPLYTSFHFPVWTYCLKSPIPRSPAPPTNTPENTHISCSHDICCNTHKPHTHTDCRLSSAKLPVGIRIFFLFVCLLLYDKVEPVTLSALWMTRCTLPLSLAVAVVY